MYAHVFMYIHVCVHRKLLNHRLSPSHQVVALFYNSEVKRDHLLLHLK